MEHRCAISTDSSQLSITHFQSDWMCFTYLSTHSLTTAKLPSPMTLPTLYFSKMVEADGQRLPLTAEERRRLQQATEKPSCLRKAALAGTQPGLRLNKGTTHCETKNHTGTKMHSDQVVLCPHTQFENNLFKCLLMPHWDISVFNSTWGWLFCWVSRKRWGRF